ncbi:hypothetical protein D3C73_832610 [compost metagenome]
MQGYSMISSREANHIRHHTNIILVQLIQQSRGSRYRQSHSFIGRICDLSGKPVVYPLQLNGDIIDGLLSNLRGDYRNIQDCRFNLHRAFRCSQLQLQLLCTCGINCT